MNGFERRRQEKMDAILRTASELFMERGVKAVTIADIADKAKVSQVTIYNYFGSKDGLAKQVLFTLMDQRMSEAEEVLASGIPFREKLEKLIFEKLEALTDSNLELFQRVFPNDPDVRRFLEEYYQTRGIPFMVQLIEQGKREGCINPALSTEAVLLWTDVVWKAAVSRPDVYASLTKKMGRDLNELFYYGLLGQPDIPRQ
jgi:AcrR family transcriptional regulator